MLQDLRNKPEGQRLPSERADLLRLESRSRWGREFELWENWEGLFFDDDDIPF